MSTPFDPYEELGILPSERPVDHYRLLGLRRFEDNRRRIENAAQARTTYIQKLAADQVSAEATTMILQEIAEAHRELSDPEKKKRYDQDLRRSIETSPTGADGSRREASTPRKKPNRNWVGILVVAAPAGVLLVLLAYVFWNMDDTESNIEPNELAREGQPVLVDASSEKESTEFSKRDLQAGDRNNRGQTKQIVLDNGVDRGKQELRKPVPGPEELVGNAVVSNRKSDPDVIAKSNRSSSAGSTPDPFSTSFENLKVGGFDELNINGVKLVCRTGKASINSKFAKTGRQCLHLNGGQQNSVEWWLPDSQQEVRGLSFHAERWTFREPFAFTVDIRQNDAWWPVAKLDSHVVVGARFRSLVNIGLPQGKKTALRFTVTSPADTGLLIDDIKLLSEPPPSSIEIPELDPFVNLADNVDLPPTDDDRPFRIGMVGESKKFLLAAELLMPETTVRQIEFSLKRADLNKQLWFVAKRDRSDAQPVPIGKFWKTENELFFQWLPNGKGALLAEQLRNCVIKLTSSRSFFVNLRKPVVINNFRLAAEDDTIRTPVDIPWLPNAKLLQIELEAFPESVIPSHCIPHEVTQEPARMFFTKDESKALMWLEVASKSRTLRQLQARLVVNLRGRIQEVAPNEIEKLPQQFTGYAKTARTRAEVSGNGAVKKQLADAASAADASAKIFQDYVPIARELVGKDIPIVIYFVVGKRKVLIAKTPGVVSFDNQVYE